VSAPAFAVSLEEDALHMAVYDAHEAGLSVRQAATALQVPKSTIARHWRLGHACRDLPPIWGSEREWSDAHAAVWSHDADRDGWVPYQWTEGDDGARTVKLRARGIYLFDPSTAKASLHPTRDDG